MSIESTVLPMLRPNRAKVNAEVEWRAVKYGNVELVSAVVANCPKARNINYFDALEEAKLVYSSQ